MFHLQRRRARSAPSRLGRIGIRRRVDARAPVRGIRQGHVQPPRRGRPRMDSSRSCRRTRRPARLGWRRQVEFGRILRVGNRRTRPPEPACKTSQRHTLASGTTSCPMRKVHLRRVRTGPRSRSPSRFLRRRMRSGRSCGRTRRPVGGCRRKLVVCRHTDQHRRSRGRTCNTWLLGNLPVPVARTRSRRLARRGPASPRRGSTAPRTWRKRRRTPRLRGAHTSSPRRCRPRSGVGIAAGRTPCTYLLAHLRQARSRPLDRNRRRMRRAALPRTLQSSRCLPTNEGRSRRHRRRETQLLRGRAPPTDL